MDKLQDSTISCTTKQKVISWVNLVFILVFGFGVGCTTRTRVSEVLEGKKDVGRERTVIILGINQATVKHLPSGLREIGFEPIFILDPAKGYEGESKNVLQDCEVYWTEVDSPEKVAELLTDNPDVVRRAGSITSFVDPLFPVVRLMAQRFGMVGPDQAIPRLSEKADLYRLLPEYCPRHVIFTAKEADSKDFSGLSAEKEWILKPSLSAAASGITVLPRGVNLHIAVPAAIKSSLLNNAQIQTWILQERIPGRLVSLEGFVRNGAVNFLGFSVRARVRLSESLNEFPGDEHLSSMARNRCRETLQVLVKRSEYKNGYFHCEFLIQGDTTYLIDGNIGRIAGAAVAEQIALSFGLQPPELIRHVALLAIRPEEVQVPFKIGPDKAVKTFFVAYGIRQGAVLGKVQLPHLGNCKHTLFAALGKPVVPMGTSDSAAIGGVSGLKEEVIRVLDGIVIKTDQGPMQPAFTLQDEP